MPLVIFVMARHVKVLIIKTFTNRIYKERSKGVGKVMEVNSGGSRISQSAALARYSGVKNQIKAQPPQAEPSRQEPVPSSPRKDEPAVLFQKSDYYQPKIEDESYQELVQQARSKKEERKQEAHSLALKYSKNLGHDIQDNGPGQAWFEKTVDFYSSSDQMVKRLQELVETSDRI